jgi:hypothetical protein
MATSKAPSAAKLGSAPPDARTKIDGELADLSVEQGKLLDAQYTAKVEALNARIAEMNKASGKA